MRSIEEVKDPRAALQLQALLTSAGFTEIQTNMVPLPMCAWGTGTRAFLPNLGRETIELNSQTQHEPSLVKVERMLLTISSAARHKTTPDWRSKQRKHPSVAEHARHLPVHAKVRYVHQRRQRAREPSTSRCSQC